MLRKHLRVLLAFVALPALSAPPDPPAVTTGANIKQLRFDWNYVPRANWYELWFRANAGAAEAKFGEVPSWRPRVTSSVSAHLLDWPAARYRVKACNPGGCTASPPISVADLMFDSIGYFKGNPSRGGANYGWAVDVSEDGNTMAVLAIMEPNDSGTNPDGASIYIYVKSGGAWRQQAKLRLDPDGYDDDDVASLSLSGDGNVLALGLPFSLYKPPALGGGTGGVFLFRRNGTTWSQEQRIEHAYNQDFFGYPVEVDESGDTLLVGHGSNGRGGDDGRAWIYQHGATGWSQAKELPPPDGFDCQVMTLSGDGNTVARGCQQPGQQNHRLEVYAAPTWAPILTRTYLLGVDRQYEDISTDYSASVIALSEMPAIRHPDNRRWVYLCYKVDGAYPDDASDTLSGPWQKWHEDKYGVTRFGEHVAVSRNADFIAVTDANDSGAGAGVLSYPLAKGTRASGAVFVYERKSSPYYAHGYYGLRRILKPNVPGSATASFDGVDIAFGQAGKTLAVTQPFETSRASGIDGDRTDTSLPSAGAVWLY